MSKLNSSDVTLVLNQRANKRFQELQKDSDFLTYFHDSEISKDKQFSAYLWQDQSTDAVQKFIIENALNELAPNDFKFMAINNDYSTFESQGNLECEFNKDAKRWTLSGRKIAPQSYSCKNDVALVIPRSLDNELKKKENPKLTEFFSWHVQEVIEYKKDQICYLWQELEQEEIDEILKPYLATLNEEQFMFIRLGSEYPDYEQFGSLYYELSIFPENELTVERW